MFGSSIAHYHITAKLGQGGMGEVYRATDTKLGREVAIKVLPDAVARDTERLARFEREAKLLAQLSHPNIAGVYGLEQHGDTQALVLELVEGKDLSLLLKQNTLSIEEALEVGKQIAEALVAAHEKGIIHRDLKPGNIKITDDRRVKVLDFGLAKALSEESDMSKADHIDDSPTITDVFTKPGTILGTAAYMSPEQAKGKHVDKRTDIWAFGCVLYECLSGKKAFKGEDVTDTSAKIILGTPDWSLLPHNTPLTIELLLKRCLAKDRRKRQHQMDDAAVDLEQALSEPSCSIIQAPGQALDEQQRIQTISKSSIIALAVCMLTIGVVTTWFLKPESTPSLTPPLRQIAIELEKSKELVLNYGTAVRISPDESTLAYIDKSDETGARRLMIRPLNKLDAYLLPETKGVTSFCFSKDSRWICYGTRNTNGSSIRKISVDGETSTTLCKAENPRGVSWANDGWIYFAENFNSGLSRVRDYGGEPEPVTKLTEGEYTHKWPEILPDGKSILFTSSPSGSDYEDARVMIQSISGGEPKELLKGYHARYLESGHVAYIHQDSLCVELFDLKNLSLSDTKRVPIIANVYSNQKGGSHFDISPAGTLIYISGQFRDQVYHFEWVDRMGKKDLLPLSPNNYRSFKLSPDGEKLALVIDSGKENEMDIWIYELDRGTMDRLTFGNSHNKHPIWSPDGKYVAFSSDRDGADNIYVKSADNNGETIRLTESTTTQIPWSWSPDGERIAIFDSGLEGENNLCILHLNGNNPTTWSGGHITNFVANEFTAFTAAFSHDGNWMTYASSESGMFELYVREFPGGGNRRQVSIEGQTSGWPVWSSRSQELIFMGKVNNEGDEMMVLLSTVHIQG